MDGQSFCYFATSPIAPCFIRTLTEQSLVYTERVQGDPRHSFAAEKSFYWANIEINALPISPKNQWRYVQINVAGDIWSQIK